MTLPNVEGMVTAHLTASVGVAPVPALPEAKMWPAIRVTRWGGSPKVAHPFVLDRALVQVDVWATRKQAAWDLSSRVQESLTSDFPGVHALGVVTLVEPGQFSYRPDDVFDPPIPRYVLDFTIYARPLRG